MFALRNSGEVAALVHRGEFFQTAVGWPLLGMASTGPLLVNKQ